MGNTLSLGQEERRVVGPQQPAQNHHVTLRISFAVGWGLREGGAHTNMKWSVLFFLSRSNLDRHLDD